jgi:dienelactone hydrolase
MEPPLKTRDQLSLIDKTKNTATVSTTLPPWLVKHRQSVSKPIIDSFISTVRAIPGTQKVGTVGFSWGGRYAILAAYGDVDAAYACHPSPLNVPEDLRPVSKPLSLALGDKDSFLDRNAMGQIQDALAVKTDVPHELRIYEDQIHGFTLRDDWSGDKDRKAMDEAEMQGIEWFCRYLS